MPVLLVEPGIFFMTPGIFQPGDYDFAALAGITNFATFNFGNALRVKTRCGSQVRQG